jgi:hypothetical protein
MTGNARPCPTVINKHCLILIKSFYYEPFINYHLNQSPDAALPVMNKGGGGGVVTVPNAFLLVMNKEGSEGASLPVMNGGGGEVATINCKCDVRGGCGNDTGEGTNNVAGEKMGRTDPIMRKERVGGGEGSRLQACSCGRISAGPPPALEYAPTDASRRGMIPPCFLHPPTSLNPWFPHPQPPNSRERLSNHSFGWKYKYLLYLK